MWLFTTLGFYSIVQKYNDSGTLVIRARVREDLEGLKKRFKLRQRVISLSHTDYPYRIELPRVRAEGVISELAKSILYNNFKDAVKKTQGSRRASLYMDIWMTMNNAEEKLKPGPYHVRTRPMGHGVLR